MPSTRRTVLLRVSATRTVLLPLVSATPLGVLKRALIPLPLVLPGLFGLPAIGLICPENTSIRLIVWVWLSAIAAVQPWGSMVIGKGSLEMSVGPIALAMLREARVVTRPVATSILRMARLPVSPTNANVPSGLRA